MKHYVSSDETAKMDITYKRLQKLISSYETAIHMRQKAVTDSGPQSNLCLTIPLSLSTCWLTLFFKYIIVYNYTRTSKQKFPFVSEAKEGYLSTAMSYSCMDVSRLHHTKSLTKVVPSYEVAGFHKTAPIWFCPKSQQL